MYKLVILPTDKTKDDECGSLEAPSHAQAHNAAAQKTEPAFCVCLSAKPTNPQTGERKANT